MSKYGDVARLAARGARGGTAPQQAWEEAAEAMFPHQGPSRDKSCPRCAFLGLAEDGLIVGVPSGAYTGSELTKRYAIRSVDLLRQKPHLADEPSELWRRVVCTVVGERNKIHHNNQMDVVTALWSNGDIVDMEVGRQGCRR